MSDFAKCSTLQVAALQDTPEYRLGIRRNAQMNPGKKTTRNSFLCFLMKQIIQLCHPRVDWLFLACCLFCLKFPFFPNFSCPYFSFCFSNNINNKKEYLDICLSHLFSPWFIGQNLLSFPGRNYTQLEDIRQDLLSRVVKGALVDSYVAAERKDLFDDPALYIHQVKVMVSPPCRGHKGVPTP